MIPRFSLDANILVYAADANAGARKEAATELIARAARCDCVLTLQSLAEFFSVVTRKRLAMAVEAASQVQRWATIFGPPVSADSAALTAAMQAASAKRFQFWDALLLATARGAGCVAMLTEDMHPGAELSGIQIVPAFDAHGALSAEALRVAGADAPSG